MLEKFKEQFKDVSPQVHRDDDNEPQYVALSRNIDPKNLIEGAEKETGK